MSQRQGTSRGEPGAHGMDRDCEVRHPVRYKREVQKRGLSEIESSSIGRRDRKRWVHCRCLASHGGWRTEVIP